MTPGSWAKSRAVRSATTPPNEWPTSVTPLKPRLRMKAETSAAWSTAE